MNKKVSKERNGELILKIDISRWECLRNEDFVFYGQLMMNLRDSITYDIPTACTNGKSIKWNPDFLDKLTQHEVTYILIHETDHCALGHLWRFDFKDKKTSVKANQACDHAINLRLNSVILKNNIKFIKMPDGGLADPKFQNLSEEEIYHLLPDPPNNDPNGGFGDFEKPEEGSPEEGSPEDGEGNGEKFNNSLKERWTRNVIQAAQVCKSTSYGTMPNDIQRQLDKQMCQRINWKDEMSHFLRTSISVKNDYTRSSKRNSWQPVIIPRKKVNEISRCVFVRDTSGSIDDVLLGKFNALIEQCMSEMGNCAIVIDCDTEIGAIYEIGPGVEVPKTAKGNGGTDFREPFIKCKELIDNGEEVAGLVYLTDGFGVQVEPANYPDFPVLWLSITKDFTAPFGKTVFVDEITSNTKIT